jgi:hypothetical protein
MHASDDVDPSSTTFSVSITRTSALPSSKTLPLVALVLPIALNRYFGYKHRKRSTGTNVGNLGNRFEGHQDLNKNESCHFVIPW